MTEYLDRAPDNEIVFSKQPNECVVISPGLWGSLCDTFREEHGFELPDEGRFAFGGPRSDNDSSAAETDQMFQGQVIRQDDAVVVEFIEELYDDRRYFSAVFEEQQCDIQPINPNSGRLPGIVDPA